jgi:hypothetical protein
MSEVQTYSGICNEAGLMKIDDLTPEDIIIGQIQAA